MYSASGLGPQPLPSSVAACLPHVPRRCPLAADKSPPMPMLIPSSSVSGPSLPSTQFYIVTLADSRHPVSSLANPSPPKPLNGRPHSSPIQQLVFTSVHSLHPLSECAHQRPSVPTSPPSTLTQDVDLVRERHADVDVDVNERTARVRPIRNSLATR